MDPITRTYRICIKPTVSTLTHRIRGQLLTVVHTCAFHRRDTRADWPGSYVRPEPGQVCGHALDYRPYPEPLIDHPRFHLCLPQTPDADWPTALRRCTAAYSHAPAVVAPLMDAAQHAEHAHDDPDAARKVLLAVAAAERAGVERNGFPHNIK
jgi:hypothetical protein